MTTLSNKWNKRSTAEEFKAIFSLYYAPLCGYVERIIKDKDLSEEIVQEFFLGLWEGRKKKDISNLKSYLFSAVYKKALHHIEHEKVKEKHRQHESQKQHHYPTPDEGLLLSEMHQAYQEELAQLKDKTRDIFLMSRNEEMTYSAIAKQLSISIKTVEAHISQALNAFRRRFEKIK